MKIKNKFCLLFSVFLALVLCFSVSVALAAEFRASKKGSINVSASERPRNLYAAGNMINVDGSVSRDMLAAGNIVNINNNIGDDLWLAAGTIVIQGDIGGSLRVAGGNVLVNGKVNEDILVAGGTVTLSRTAAVGGDIAAAGGMIDVECSVGGNIYMVGGQAVINSRVDGNVNVKLDESLELGSRASIGGDLKYCAPKEAVFQEGAFVFGETEFTKKTIKGKWKKDSLSGMFFGFLAMKFLMRLLILIVSGIVIVYFFNKISQQVVKKGLKRAWADLGKGFIVLIIVPIICIILLVTVIGSKLAAILGLIYALTIILAGVLGSVTFGSWLVKVLWKKKDYSVDWRAVIAGAVAYSILCIIPLVGWLVAFFFMLIALGELYRMVKKNVVSVKSLK